MWEELYSQQLSVSRFSKATLGFRSTSPLYWRLYSLSISILIGHMKIHSWTSLKCSMNTQQSYCYTWLLDLLVDGWQACTSEMDLVCGSFLLFVQIWAPICISYSKISTRLTKRNAKSGKQKERLRRKKAARSQER